LPIAYHENVSITYIETEKQTINMKTEKIVTLIFILALIARLLDLPGPSILLILSLGIISILYFPLAFYFFSDKTINRQNIALSIVGGMVLAIIPLGILFKIMFWPGAQIELTASLILTPILLIITIILSRNSNEELKIYYKNYLTRIIFWLTLCIVFYFVSNSTLIRIQNHNDPELVRLKIQSFENPDNEEYYNDLQNYYRQRDSLYMVNERQK
jgi:hypothetical protein